MKLAELKVTQRIFLVVLVALTISCAWLAPVDSAASQHVDAGLKRALISFATARALNGVISVAQGTQVAIEPGGVGVNLAPGELLDPLNDLVEQFADLMLAASVAFGVERILISIGAHQTVSIALTLAILFWGALRWYRGTSPAWLSRALLLILMVRFALPITLIGTDLLFNQFMLKDYQSSQYAIDDTTAKIDELAPATSGEPQGMIDKFKGWVAQNTDLKARLAGLRQAAENTTEHVIKLMAIFVLQTLILPIFLLWSLWHLAKRVFADTQTGTLPGFNPTRP